MAASKGKYGRSLIGMIVLIGVLWGASIGIHQSRVSSTEEGEPKPALVNLGLDLQGGISVVLSPVGEGEVDKGALEKAKDVIEQRVDGLGVAEPEIAVQGSNIAIQLPGLTKARQALDLIGTTAKLSFRPVLQAVPPAEFLEDAPDATDIPEGLPTCGDQSTYAEDDPEAQVVYCRRAADPVTGAELPPSSWDRLLLGPVALDGADVSGARAQIGDAGGGWSVEIDLNGEGADKFEAVTGTLACQPLGDVTRQLAIVLDGVIESSPQAGDDVQCNDGIGGGTAIITGSFNQSEAKDLALVLRYGALPIELEAATTTTVSPTLGKDSLRGGLLGGGIGLFVVLLYVLAFYRALGLVIWLGLLLHGSLTLAVVVLLGQTVGFTLTLAGIAGLIISLGIATDSFIVYLERLKDEVRQGRSARAAIDRAWAASWRTIVAADIVTAMAAVILYLIAVGSVRGFALMLGLATLLDIVVSRYYMHPAVWLLGRTGIVRSATGEGRMAKVTAEGAV